MKRHLIFKILLISVAVTMPAIQAAIVGADYSVSGPPGPPGPPGTSGLAKPVSVLAPPVAAGEEPGGAGGSGGPGPPSPPSQAGNVSAVSAILHPKAPREAEAVAVYEIPEPMTQEDTREFILNESINAYPGPCACPYSRNSDGFECGVEAAYYKPGGYRIHCYPEDLKGQDYIFYRKTH